VAVDEKGTARVRLGPAPEPDHTYLARRAARVRKRWAATFALDDGARRKRLGLPPPGPAAPLDPPWRYTLDPGPLWVEATRKRPLLVWIEEEESTVCRRLEHYTLREAGIARLLAARFLPVRVPLGLCAKDPRKGYGVVAVPALAVVGPSGAVLWRHTGFITPRALRQALLAISDRAGKGRPR
jgi:hypothetical protein